MSEKPLVAGVYARQSRGKTKSVDEQLDECTQDGQHHGWALSGTYTDLVSASRYGRRQRGDHLKLLDDIHAKRLDVVITWSPDRTDRTLTTWSAFLDACRDNKVLIRITDHERTYDMNNPRDWRSLAEDGIDAAYFSEKLSRSVLRGVGGAAKVGRPPMGPCPYGYRRMYDPSTGKLRGEFVEDSDGSKRWVGGQEPDPLSAPVVQEIFRRVAKGEPLGRIADDLNCRKVPPPGSISHSTGSQKWYRERVRNIALNPAYIGKRRHRATGRNVAVPPVLFDAGWDALVDEATFYAAVRVLRQPGRSAHTRPGRQVHLLTYLGVCHRGHPLRAQVDAYSCAHGCVHVKREPVDRLVCDRVLAYLRQPEVYRLLRRAGEDADREVVAAENELASLREQLDDWRRSVTDGRGTTPETMAAVEADLSRKIAAAQRRAQSAGLPPALRQVLEPGADVASRWRQAPLPARREIIRALVVVELLPSGRNWTVAAEQRVRISPRLRG